MIISVWRELRCTSEKISLSDYTERMFLTHFCLEMGDVKSENL